MRCTRRTTRRLLWTTGCLALAGGGAAAYVIAFGHSFSAKDTAQQAAIQPTTHGDIPTTPVSTSGGSGGGGGGVTAKDFEPLWALDLRRPLYDAPPTKVEKPVFKPPPFTAKLSGTIIDAGQATAIFTDGQGKTVFLQEGQSIDQATIERIEPKQVTLRYYEQELVIPLNTEEPRRR